MISTKTGKDRIAVNTIIMIGITISLFWLPVIGSFVAGFIGSRKINSPYIFLYTMVIAGIITGILFFLLAHNMTALPVVGAIARKGSLFLSLSFTLPLLAGCFTGFSYGK